MVYEENMPPITEHQIQAWERDRKAQRKHEWRLKHPVCFLLENLTDWLFFGFLVIVVVYIIWGM